MKLFNAFLVLIGLLLVLMFADCIAGSSRHLEATVSRLVYYPPYTTSHVETDGRITTEYHAEEWHAVCSELGTGDTIDVGISRNLFYTVTNGQPVTVCVRVGRWSGINWNPSIEL